LTPEDAMNALGGAVSHDQGRAARGCRPSTPDSPNSERVGQAVWLLQPIVDGIRNHVFAAEKVHADDGHPQRVP
jgi:hypothetical protein